MAGGLFGRPFVFNIKCIIFSLIIMGLFLFNPVIKNKLILGLILFIIFVVSYVAMAWYDFYYNCRLLPLKRGTKSLTGILKPDVHSEKQINETNMSRGSMMIYASHIVFIVPLLIYIAYYKGKANQMIYPILIVLALFTLLYHGMGMITGSHNL